MAERFIIAGKAVWFYAAKVLWPAPLTFVYPRWAVDAELTVVLDAAIGIAGCRCGSVGVATTEIGLEPACLDAASLWRRCCRCWDSWTCIYFRYSFVADHFQYLASLGLITLIAAAGVSLCSRVGRQGARIGVVAAAVLLAISATLTWRQAHIYRNAETLWRDTLAKNPRCWLAHTNLGVELEKSGRFQEAMSHYRLALLSNPSFAEAHYDLGTVLMRAGTRRDAIAHLEQAVQLRPDWPPPKNNLAWALATFPRTEGGDPRRATEVAENLGNLSGNRSPDYLDTMAVAYAAAGRFSEAIATAQKAIDLARAAGQPKLAAEIEARLQLYRSGRAYHEPLSNKP
jgi:protein O-mannosyl-transferase